MKFPPGWLHKRDTPPVRIASTAARRVTGTSLTAPAMQGYTVPKPEEVGMESDNIPH